MDQQRLGIARQKLVDDPYDIEAWLLVIKDAQSRKMDDSSRATFEKLISLFPTSGRFWKTYIEQEVSFLMLFNQIVLKNKLAR